MRIRKMLYGVFLVFVWSATAFAVTGDQIVDQALGYNGQCCWTCKVFVQQVLADLGITLDYGYREAYLAIAEEISDESLVRRGDLGQVSNGTDPGDEAHVHSFIVMENHGNGMMEVVHSNWNPPYEETVSVDNRDFGEWASQWPGWSVHYYRLKVLNVGNWSDGSTEEAILTCYNRHGGIDSVGCPIDNGGSPYVHEWYSENGYAHVVIQDFYNPTTDEYYAIIYNSIDEKAYLLQGGFRWQYLGNPNAPYEYGVALSDEVLDWTDAQGQFGEVGKTYGAIQVFDLVVMLWDTATDEILIEPRNGFTITLIPSDDPLVLSGWPSSTTSVYLATNEIGATFYQLYEEGGYLADLVDTRLVVNGLTPGQTYAYYVLAYDASGQLITESNHISVTMPTNNLPDPIEVEGKATIMFQDGPNMVQPGGEYEVTIGVRNDTNTTISNIRGGIYPFRNGEFDFNPAQDNNYLRFNYSGTVVSGQVVTIAEFTISVIGDYENINIQTEIDYDVDILGLSRATYGSFRLPVGVYVDPGVVEVESSTSPPATFTDDFSDPSTLGTNWVTYASNGEVSIQDGKCRMQNGNGYAGINLIAPGFDELTDVSVILDLNNNLGGSGNQITEIHLRQNNDSWVGVRIKDKESHWVWLIDSNNQVTGYADLIPGRYQLSIVGDLITFQNLPGSGAPIYVEMYTSVTSPGSVTIQVNEEIVTVDNVVVENLDLSQEEPIPNITITDVDYQPQPIHAGESITVSANLLNDGDATMPAQTVAVVLGQNVYGTVNAPTLASGESYIAQISFGTPTTLSDVTFYVVADFDDTAEESNEQDNAQPLAVSFLPPRQPDLIVSSYLFDPVEIWTGDAITVVVSMENIGLAGSEACNASLDRGDISLCQSVPALAPGQSTEVAFELSPCVSPGAFTWQTHVDCDDDVAEENEGNNEGEVTFEVISPLGLYPSPQIAYGGYVSHEILDDIFVSFYFEVTNRYEYPPQMLERLMIKTWSFEEGGNLQYNYGVLEGVTYSCLTRAWSMVFPPLIEMESPVNFIVIFEDNVDGTILESNVVTISPPSGEMEYNQVFQSGLPGDWETDGNGDSPLVSTRSTLYGGNIPLTGNRVLFLGDGTDNNYVTTWVQKRFDLTGQGYQSGRLETDVCTYSLYSPEYVAVKIWDGAWHALAGYSGTSWKHYSFDLSSFDLSGEIIVRFESYMNYTERADAAYVDNLKLTLSAQASEALPVVFSDDFESGLGSWQLNAGASGATPLVRTDSSPYGGLAPQSGSNVLYLGDSTSSSFAVATADLELNLAGKTQASLEYVWATYRLEASSDYVALDIYDGTWHYDVERLQVYTSAPSWVPVTVDMGNYNLIDGFVVRFRSYMNYQESSDAAYVDDVKVTAQ